MYESADGLKYMMKSFHYLLKITVTQNFPDSCLQKSRVYSQRIREIIGNLQSDIFYQKS